MSEQLPDTKCQEIESPRGNESLGATRWKECGEREHFRARHAWENTAEAIVD